MAPSLLHRLFGTPVASSSVALEPKRLLPSTEIKTLGVDETKSSVALLPRGAYGPNYVFFSPDGGQTIIDITDGAQTVIAFVAYWYIATRWKAMKLAEAPLMVVQEDQQTGDEEWLSEHELVPTLEQPSDDYDMGELLECTSYYMDNTGAALWVLDQDQAGRVARITPFSRQEFEVKSDGQRLYATFTVQTADGPKTFTYDEVCYFRDSHATVRWGSSKSRLDVALSWLKLGTKAQSIIHDLLHNSVWPSAVIIPDKDWDPSPELLQEYQQALQNYAKNGNKGKPFVALGGGSFTSLASSIKELVPDAILNRVESVVAAVSGVPAIVLQFQVGLENSPWSQMAQARRMAYDDTIQPTWKKWERVLTRQLLRPVDEDPTHFMRFDTSQIESLKRDQLEAAQTATAMGRAATLNERRAIMGLEPATPKQDPDGKADQIPELSTPSLTDLLNASQGNPPSKGGTDGNPQDATATRDGQSQDSASQASQRKALERKFAAPSLIAAFRHEAQTVWELHAHRQLRQDADAIAEIVTLYITPAVSKSIESKARGKDRTMSAVSRYLNEDGRKGWAKSVGPLATRAATRAGAVIGADLGINYNLLHPHLLTFAREQVGEMITQINGTTKQLVNDIITAGLEEQRSVGEIAGLIRDATGFSKSRALLIARTETTAAFNGAPTESLSAVADSLGKRITKTWSGVLDDRERDEHVALEGETVGIDETFSNGLDYPQEPNCRCTLLYNIEDA